MPLHTTSLSVIEICTLEYSSGCGPVRNVSTIKPDITQTRRTDSVLFNYDRNKATHTAPEEGDDDPGCEEHKENMDAVMVPPDDAEISALGGNVGKTGVADVKRENVKGETHALRPDHITEHYYNPAAAWFFSDNKQIRHSPFKHDGVNAAVVMLDPRHQHSTVAATVIASQFAAVNSHHPTSSSPLCDQCRRKPSQLFALTAIDVLGASVSALRNGSRRCPSKHTAFTTEDLKIRKTNLLTERPDSLSLNIKDLRPKTESSKDLLCKDIVLKDVVP
ncbi:uncharacterized protein LACBIDRAFT_335912 [Laccaria bicolor S238N-H82]|uniref:Predicted protein n=1 Tax=Laccaria bicolor (strain S238N-H82 / ATCC MYA-4686) TaxID=486041 RepID=B0E3T4_LACBS|nr:uncharacterized protein LACBIDRAFT_335912 [Laccaria bicolor S238N-H82]EDQ98496.1 predicted protein [Laccaria bicolor S238N-H82]|eukprot:XP_001890852.1 predicted protein [Laccaria bicolor S238N-H82]